MSSSEEDLDRDVSEEEEMSENEIPEEEEEDSEEDEDEHVSSRHKRKGSSSKSKPAKKRKAVNKFIEEEADVDDDEEEEDEDEDDFYSSERQLALKSAQEQEEQYRYEPQNHSRYDDSETAEEIVNRIKKRHQQTKRHYDEDMEGGEGMTTDVAQQSLLPSIQDPRMWVFKCKPGREQALVVALMNKFLEFAQNGEPLLIKSVVASISKGFIYVEAEREPHAKDALNGLRDVQQYSMKLVPIHEMTSIFKVAQKRKPVVAGSWGRLKRAGLYKGDLCKVVEILDNGSRAVIQLIPRIDPSILVGGEPQQYKKGQRPPQKLFNPDVLPNADIVRRRFPSTGDMMDVFENDFYYRGFLMKEINISTMLQTDEVNPTLDEINKFSYAAGEENTNGDFATALDADDWKNKVDLTKGDTVKVVEGDLINLMGVVLSINTANDTVKVMPLHEEIKDTILDFQLKQLIKYVKVGDHIKVVSGRYSGETGTVVAIDETGGSPIAIVLVDSMAKEIQVRVQDLQESAEVSHGLDSLKGKELYDLVALAHGDVGVITHVGREGFTVLCQNGQSRQISDQEIQRKILSSRSAALDKKHNHVSVGEMVAVLEGPFKTHSGTVKHIYRTYLFLHNNRFMTNAGMFVAKARQTVLSGSKQRSDLIQNSSVPRLDGGGPGGGGFGGRGGPGGRGGRGSESELVGSTVKVKKGQWKGYIGIVVAETEQKVKVEIHCKAKTVDIDRLHVAIAGTRSGQIHDRPRHGHGPMATPMSSQTPMPGQTPLHSSAMTPAATPMHRSMGTPGQSRAADPWNVAGDEALLASQTNQEKDITHAATFGAPLDPVGSHSSGLNTGNDYRDSRGSYQSSANPMGSRSPRRSGMSSTSHNSNPMTPGLPPTTPAYMIPHNPSTPGLNPRTPGVSSMPTPGAMAGMGMGGISGDHLSGMEPTTPGFNPTTPGLPSMTPGLNPVTPGLQSGGYSRNPMTPGGFGMGTPMTGFGRMGAATPGVGTPAMMSHGAPTTPSAYNPSDEMNGANENNGNTSGEVTWKMRGVEVVVTSGEYEGSVGVIIGVTSSMCTMDVDGRQIEVSWSNVQPVVPEKQDTVMILYGEEAGKTVSMIGKDGSEGIVKVDGGSEIKIFPIASLVKIAQ